MNKVMWDDSPINVTTEVNFIWSIANKLRPTYTEEKYKDVIIPMTIIRRFECALSSTKDDVLETIKKNPNRTYRELCKVSGFQFYNTSHFSLEKLCNDPDNIADNLKSYINAFSSNVKDILFSEEKGLDFDKQINKMDKNDRLYNVVKAFSELDLDPKTIDNMKMGYIFEELIRRFSENAEAGDHYTGRDIIKTMVSILLAEGCDDIFEDHKIITIADYACGTGGMLSTAYNYIKRYNPTADIRLFGQEINPESYAICLAEMLIKGQNAEDIRYQDTMKVDSFENIKMRFVIENPPFGTPWGGKDAANGVENAVKKEHLKGVNGRFPAGLPKTSDMQMLFLQDAINKMDEHNGRAAIIENGSPLFSGGTSSGESQIRRYMLENDLIEAIIALPTDLFYNTGIATYIWILSKNKRTERVGKIQLIDATSFSNKLRKALGEKKNELSTNDRETITKIYADFSENEYSKIYDNDEFIYREYAIMEPLQRSYAINKERIENLINSNVLNKLFDPIKVAVLEEKEELTGKEEKQLQNFIANKIQYDNILDTLNRNINGSIYMNKEEFKPMFENAVSNINIDKKLQDKIMDGLSVMDKNADIVYDKKGNIVYDKDTKDSEIVPIKEDINDYMNREVLPHVPDAKAFFEENLNTKKPNIKTGAEIPFTRYFYKYEKLENSTVFSDEFIKLENSIQEKLKNLFGRGDL